MDLGRREFQKNPDTAGFSHCRRVYHQPDLPTLYLIALESLLIYHDYRISAGSPYFTRLLELLQAVPDAYTNHYVYWLNEVFMRGDVSSIDQVPRMPQFTQWISDVLTNTLNPRRQALSLEALIQILPICLYQPGSVRGNGIPIYLTYERDTLVFWYPKQRHYGEQIWPVTPVPKQLAQTQSLPVFRSDGSRNQNVPSPKPPINQPLQCVLCQKRGKQKEVFMCNGLEYHLNCFQKSFSNKKLYSSVKSIGINRDEQLRQVVKAYFQKSKKSLKGCVRCHQELKPKNGCGCRCAICSGDITVCPDCEQAVKGKK